MSHEYFKIEAINEFPGSLPPEDLLDAIANMNSSEWYELKLALVEYRDSEIGWIIRKSICRQYSDEIQRRVEDAYDAHLEAEREDALECQRNARKGE